MSHHSLTNCKIRTLAAETRDDVGQTNELKTPTTRKPLFMQRLFWLWSLLALPGLFNRMLLARGSEGSVVHKKYQYKFVQTSLVFLFLSGLGYSQSIFTNPITGTSINADPYSTGQVLNANITSTGIGRGAGTAQSAANDRYNVSGVNSTSLANAITANDYFEFSITPNACKEIDFTNLVYTSQISTGGINLALRSSVNAYATDIATSTSTTGATFSLTDASLQNITSNITFRLYVWGATAGGTTFSINEFTFNGTATSTPTVGVSANVTTLCTGGTINLTGTTNVTGNFVAGQVNFENSATYTAVGGQTRTGNSASGDRPASVSFVTSPTTSYSVTNGTATITTQNFSGLPSGATKTISMRLAAFSVGATNNGVDAGDNVKVEISLDGGTTYSQEIQVNGNSNAYWDYTTGTGVASINYDGNNSATVFAPGGGGARTTDGYSTLQISLPTSATQVRVRVGMINDSNNERWVIDDIILTQSIVPTYAWTSVPAGFTSSLQNPTGVTVSGNTAYTLTATNPITGCSNSSSVSITATPNNTVGAASSTPTLCINTALTSITHTTTGATGIGAATGLPAGVTAAWAANTITISGTPTASGAFNYSIPLTGGCGSVNATGTITVTPANTPGTASSNPTLCINTALTNITRTTTGATGIGAATGLPAGVNPAWASNTLTISGTPTASGTFNYSIPLTGGCGAVNATGTITVLNGTIDYANIQFPGSQTICIGNNLTAYGQIYEAGVTEAAGANAIIEAQIGYNSTNTNPNTWAAGNWTNATYNVQSGNNDEYAGTFGSALAAGTYYYAFRYRMNGCAWQYGGFNGTGGGFYNGTTNNNGVLTVSPNNTPGTASSTPTLCINTALTNITRTTTGATGISNAGVSGANGLPAGVSASWASNVITISGTPTASGTFSYSIPLTGGCGTANATGTITVTPANTISLTSAAGTNAQLRCINTAITNITYATSGASGATFSGLPAGVNGNWASNVATISGTPTAYGVYNYTVTLTGGCGSVTATGSINVNGLDYGNLQFPGTQTICPGNNFTAYGQVFEPGITEAAGANVNIVAQFGYHTSNTDPSTWPAGNWSATTYSTQSGNNDEYRIDFGAALAAGTYYYTFRYAINGCSWQYGGAFAGFWNGTTQPSGVLTVNPPTPAQPAAITGVATKCPGLTGQVYSIAAVTNATTYNWTVPTGWNITAGAGTTSITVTTGSAGQNGDISVTAQNSCGTSTARTLAVTVSPATPAQPAAITGTATQCPLLPGQVYSIAAVTNATTYNWSLPAGWAITAGSGTTSITVTTGSAGQNGNISVTAQNSCGTSTARTLAVTVSPATPIQPSLISGTAIQCPALTSQTYSIPAVTNATTYNWTVPTGWNITAGAGTTSITVTTGTTGQNGNISVTAQNSCGTSSDRTLAVTVSPAAPVQPAAITGTATQCPLLPGQVYSIAAVTNATTYNWSLPAGWAITAGSGTTSITVTTGSAGQNGNISVTAQNSCGTSTAQTLAVTVSPATPAQPSLITGTATQCPALTSQTYSIPAVADATTYNWTVPTGWNITAGAGTTSITVTTGTTGQNGNISVTAQNSCGTSSARTLAVTVSPAAPVQPAAITGTAVQCPGLTGQTYSIGAVTNATTYNWSVPTGWSITAGSGTNGITVTTGSAGQNGNISVTAQNSCGTSSAQTLAVTVSPATPAAPAAAAGSNAACTSISVNWAASANATAYLLDVSTVSDFATFVTGFSFLNVGNVTTYSVTGLTANTTYYYRVRANNSCGSSGYSSTITYATSPLPAQPSTITGTLNPEIGLTQAYSVTNVAGVTYAWSFSGPNGWSVASGQGSNAIVANVGTANTTITVVPSNTCGNGTSQTIATTIPQYRARFISANYGASPWCQNESRSISVVVKNTGTASWTNASPDVNIGAKWNTNGANWNDYMYRVDANGLAPGAQQTYTFAAMQASNATTAGAPPTYTTGLNAGNNNITFDVVKEGDCWFGGNGGTCGPGNSVFTTPVITISPVAPAAPAAITGTATQCPALTGQTYSIAGVANATSYNWSVPAGWTITANTGTSITVTTGSSGQNGNISVTAQNFCGTSTASSLAVTVSPATPSAPLVAAGTNAACTTISANWAASTNATTYFLDVSTSNTFASFVGAYNNLNVGNVTTVSVTGLTAGVTYFYRVRANNSCGTSASSSSITYATLPATPAAPAAAAGSNVACTSISANWAAAANATAYFLDVSTVNTFASFVGAYNNLNVGNVTTYSVTGLTANTTYYYRVRANNSCGTSGNSSTITYATSPLPAQPSTITGTLNPEIGLTQAYSVTNVAGVTYTWSFSGPNGWSVASGQGSNAIVANVGTANTTITVVPSNTCGNGTSQTIATTIPQYRARFISANYGASPWCQNESRSISVVVKNTGVASWTNASPDVNIGAKWNLNGADWTDYWYRMDANGLAPGATQTYTFAAMQASNATGFTAYNTPPTYVSFLNTGNNNITFDIVKELDCWFGGNGGTCGPGNAVFTTPAITITAAAPAQPLAITGTAAQCPSLTGQTYSIAGVANASSYNWSVPTGWSITANTGTSITVTTGTSGQNGNISVTAQNSCGTSIARTLAVTVSPATPAAPVAAAGTNVACTTISANWAASTNATAYLLDVSTSNTFASFVGAYNNLNVGNVTTTSVTGLTAGVTYFYRVRANNSCGTSASSSVITYSTSPATPAQPGTITGTAAQCADRTGQIYSIGSVANATTYNWSLPVGWTITAGAGTTSITVTTGAGGQNGNISVTAQNSCGTSAARTLAVTVTANPTVNVGAGLAAICAGGTSAALGGSVTAPATGGIWSTPAGGTFNPNATTLNATWTAPAAFSGTATLTLTSSGGICGTATGSKSITVNPLPANAGAITGTATVCQGQSGVSFAVPAISDATSYSWSYSGTGFTASGNTASIFGSFSSSATSGNLTVRGVNACGNGVVSATYAITVGAVPAAAGTITGSPAVCQGQNNVAFSVPTIAGATSYQWSYSGTGFTPSGNTASITANFSVSATSGILTVRGFNSCGNGVASANYTIAIAQLPGTPGTILGPSTVCKGQAGFSFTIPAIANATSYNWQYTGTGVTFSGNTNLVTVTVSNTATAGSVQVRGVSGCLNGPWSANFPISIIDPPTVSITSNYCGNPGFVILTASTGFTNYLWNTGANTPFINADIAGQYSVTVANSFGCMATATVGVATELVTNGNFSAGNTGFTTNYTYVADVAGQTEMYPEGTYAVVPNANTVHNAFWGTGHTPGGGPHLVVNGSPALGQNIWSQNNIAVQPNTTYYFSAWGLSVVNGNNAVLRFSINGSQVGTTAFLPNGYSSTAGPFNWVRFYGSWNSGFATTADLSIVNLNTILGGNDFSLDDISFGTLSPIPLAVSPSTVLGTTVCQGNELVLNANAVGGASPFTYQWTGPNGFTSTVMNPTVTASAAAVHAGTYTLTVTDGFGCTATSNVVVTISALPLNRTPVASASSVCVDESTNIDLPFSQIGVSYQLRNNADDSPIGDPVAGTANTITFPINNLLATNTYNVLATGALTQCSVEMPTTVTITVATTPVLAITNQAICSGTVDLTAAAVTAGSTGSGTLSYWTNAAGTVALGSPSSVATSGIYYIRSTAGSCSDIESVSVSISTTPQTTFSYPTTPYCSTELDPAASLNAGSVAGVFTATTAGLVFLNPANGTIDLAASTPGTYTVRNTVSPAGGCPSVNSTSSIVITQAPLTGFSYDAGSDFCQIYSAQNPAPVFEPGAAAGTFASTFGLNFISAVTGVVNLQTSTPGNYAIWNTRNAVGGCAAESDTVFIDINPYVFAGTVTTSVSDDIICLGDTIDLFSQTTAYNSVLLRERFNGAINNWVRSATGSVDGTIANAAWTLRPTNYSYNSVTHRSNDNTQFYMSNSQAQAGTSTLTTLRSPVMNTVGYTNLTMDFFQYFNTTGTSDTARVQVSLNNSTWTTVATYTAAQGSPTGFTNPVINLNAYIGQPIFYVRFQYKVTNDRLWAIDNVSLTGNCNKYTYNWVSAPAGFTSTAADPLNVVPPQNNFYVVNATNTFGCSNPSSPIPVTVNALPILTSNLTPPAVCGNELFTYALTATPAIATIDWTRPAASGISNAAITAPQVSNPNEILINTTGTDKNVIYNIRLNNNGCEQTVPVTVAVKPVPVIDIGSNLNVCNGSPAQLNTTVTNGLNVDSYAWSPATGLSSDTIADPTAIVPTASENYTVTVQATNGCTNTSAAVSVTNVGFGGTPGLWLGTTNNLWDDCRNWADGKVPDATTNVTIDGSSTGNININGAQSCNNLFFLSTGAGSRTITINPTASLTASGNVAISKTVAGGSIKLQVRNNATMACANLSLAGSSAGAANAVFQKDEVNTMITINGNFNLDPGSSFDMNDNNNGTSEGVFAIKGHFVNNANASDFNLGNVSIIFNGSALQTITCPADQDFKSVTLDNSSAAGVRLANDIAVSQQMTFVNGVFDLNSKTLTLGSATANATISGSGNNSYILSWDGADNGSVVHRVNSTGAAYLFPIGDLIEYTPFTVSLTSATLSSATLTAKLRGNAHPSINASSTIYLGRYWSVEPTGITNPLYNVSYSYAASDIVGDESFLFPAKFNSGGWQSCLESMSNAMIGNGSVNATNNTLSWTGITTFSEFSAVGNGNPLPIELLNFTAEPVDNEVQLAWTTASETNNSFFTVERSTDGIHFEEVVKQEGAGNSNGIRNYDAVDANPYLGVSYYRLKQTDFNGDFTYSEMVPVNFLGENRIALNSIFADRSNGTLNIRCSNPANAEIKIEIYDANGRLVIRSIEGKADKNWNGSIAVSQLSGGSYIARISIAGKLVHGKFIY